VVHVVRLVEVLREQPLERRAAGQEELQLAVVADAAAEPVDDVAERAAVRDLVVARVLHVPGERTDAGTGRARDAELGVLLASHRDDVRQRRQRLDVVDDRRLRVETFDRGERRLQPRHAALALERLEQRGLLAADVRAGATVHDDLEVEARTEDVLAEVALRLRLRDRRHQPVVAERELAAAVDEREVALDRVRRDHDALEQLVRVALDEHPVLERRRFAFVTVDDEVAREAVLRQERPLLAGREVRTAAAAQARRGDRGLREARVTMAQHLLQRVVAVAREEAVDRPRVVGTIVQALRDDARLREGSSGHAGVRVPEIVRAARRPAL
jgi:hypothetical protein